MSGQVSSVRLPDAKALKGASRVQKLVGDGSDIHKFVENFGLLSDAANSITTFRRLILNLAVRGMLSNDSPDAEPASALLSRVAATRAKRVADGGLRSPRTADTYDAKEPFALPNGWSWARIGEAFDVVGGIQKTPQRAPKKSHYPYLRVENVQRGALKLERMERFELADGELDRWRLVKGDLLVVEGNGSETEIGRCAVWDGSIDPCVHQNHIIRCRAIGPMSPDFVLLFLNSPAGMAEMKDLAITTSGLYSLSVGKIRGILVPIAPREEQKRIVAKVDQLMSLCDDLEAKQTKRRAIGKRLTKSALDALTTAEGPEAFDAAWKPVIENFGVLFARAESVADLRRALLDLSIRGLLTHAGETSRPARNDGPFAVPETWRWAKGTSVFTYVTSGSRGWAQHYSEEGPLFLRIGNLDYQSIALDLRKVQRVKPPKNAEGTRTRVRPGDVLVSITGDTGMVGLVPNDLGEAYINQHIALARPGPDAFPEFVARAMTAPSILGRVQGAQRGIKNSLGLDGIRELLLPVPPLDEQKRIVDKVDRLMKVCDQLETRLRCADVMAAKLVETVAAELVT